jgi:flagellar basal-body rod protein FlgB
MSQPEGLVDALQSYLSVTLSREKTISTNIANVDTPGYHTKDINFQAELVKAMDTSSAAWHGSAGSLNTTPVAHEVPGLMERADGNNVEIDREGMVMAETQLQYQMGIQLIKNEFHQIMSAINGGGN